MKLISFYKVVVLAMFLSIFSSCDTSNKKASDIESSNIKAFEGLSKLVKEPKSFSFYVLGDWGRNGFHGQRHVAQAMQEATDYLSPQFIVSTGDNFYPRGIASVNDPYIKSSFEDIYNGPNLFTNWYSVLGNHDYAGNSQAQIDYTHVSQRWQMPDRYYFFDRNWDDFGFRARFIFIDTTPFEDNYYQKSLGENLVKQDTTAQKEWLEKTLKSSTANWNIVIGHHPMYTSGSRANNKSFTRNHLESLFEKYKVSAYFAGHEHDLQHQKPDSVYTHHFISGAGSKLRETGENENSQFAVSQNGFMAVTVTATHLLIQTINSDGEVIYTTKIDNLKP